MENYLKKISRIFIFFCLVFSTQLKANEGSMIYMVLKTGLVKIQTNSEKAPKTVKRIIW